MNVHANRRLHGTVVGGVVQVAQEGAAEVVSADGEGDTLDEHAGVGHMGAFEDSKGDHLSVGFGDKNLDLAVGAQESVSCPVHMAVLWTGRLYMSVVCDGCRGMSVVSRSWRRQMMGPALRVATLQIVQGSRQCCVC